MTALWSKDVTNETLTALWSLLKRNDCFVVKGFVVAVWGCGLGFGVWGVRV
jgi:hypothetical protein